ncbi:hypothetical protein F5148DRAFT_176116 [Russula earlei]|uniref:Uncharacterized protein n=1 Tax=Russula earlei TaxID=71964 RepID=A0ACC0U6S9_9AGAM|nr:hypothetical protein F5148DRAFT_176116 [Russula earlei]
MPAAAGLTLPNPDNGKSTELPPAHRTPTTDRSPADFDDSFVLAPMPTAHLPTSSSASSTEPSLVSRMSFLNKRLSKATGMTGKSSSKRKNQLADLPLVEAQLVPSLRDTIERMTNSPGSPAAQPSAFLPNTPSQMSTHDPLPSSSQNQSYPFTPPPRHPTQSGMTQTVPTPPTAISRFPNVLDSSRIPTPVAMAKTKPNLKPALKNSIASTSLPNSAQGSQLSPIKASPSRSLRSVRSIMGRTTPQIPVRSAPSDINNAVAGNVSVRPAASYRCSGGV